MDDWTGWAAALFAFLLSLLGINYRLEKQECKKVQACNTEQFLRLSERITIVETKLVTEKELRCILHDYFESFVQPLTLTQDHIQSDLLDIKLCLANMPKRKKETSND